MIDISLLSVEIVVWIDPLTFTMFRCTSKGYSGLTRKYDRKILITTDAAKNEHQGVLKWNKVIKGKYLQNRISNNHMIIRSSLLLF